MSDAGKAVFLSYASQDAAAAQRIAAALRAAGVEVWFDQNELVGGDVWDRKIRSQIATCALFVPVISAATQARGEGYFRLEWKLAVDRSHLMAPDQPFLLPVVIDDTPDAAARVADEFRKVQWTRLPGGATPEKFCARVKTLLGGTGGDVGPTAVRAPSQRPGLPPRAGRRVPAVAWIAAAAAVAVAAVYFTVRPARNAGAGPRPPTAENAPAPLSEARQLVAKAWVQLNKPDPGRAELEVADDFCKRAAALDGTDADVWAAWSQVDSWYVVQKFDATPARRESARTKAAKALQLSPKSYEARLAQACYLLRGGPNGLVSLFPAEARALLHTLLQEQPEEPRALFALALLAGNTGNLDEARTTFGRLAKQPAFAALALSELGWTEYLHARDFRAAELAADASLAREPYLGNLLLKFEVALRWRGDLALAKATLDRIQAAELQEDFGAVVSVELHHWRRDPESMLRVLDGVSRDWLRSNHFDGPKAWWSGLAHHLAGRGEAAQLQWRTALKLVEQRLAEQSDSAELLRWKGRLQAATGDLKGAEATLRLADGTSTQAPLHWWWPVTDQILLGKRDTALTRLEQAAEQRPLQLSLANCQLNPLWDALRDEPRFKALLARLAADPQMSPNAKTSPPAAQPPPDFPPAKSIAVLAFSNLSDEKNNEYFSDGISEELLNVLAKVPGLQVAARTSAFHFKGKDTPIPDIARQLGVTYVVEGSVRKSGTRVRINAQLILAATGFQVWSEPFDRELKDIFAVQDEIAGLIAKQLSLKLGVSAPAAPVNPEAFNLYLEGLAEWNRRDRASLNKAAELFTQALALDRSFARAHALLADTGYLLAINGGLDTAESKPHLTQAQEGVERALALDPALGDAYATRATLLHFKRQDAAADADFQRALSLSPNSAFVRQRRGTALWSRGNIPVAIAELQLSIRLDPLSAINLSMLGSVLGSVRRWEDALTAHEKALACDPKFWRARVGRMECLSNLGRQVEALEMARVIADDTAMPSDFASRALALSVRTGDTAAIERAEQALAQPAQPDSRSARIRVALCLALNRVDDALAAFETARPDDMRNVALLNDPQFDPIRTDPRFLRKVEKDGLLADYREAWSHVPEPEKQKAAKR